MNSRELIWAEEFSSFESKVPNPKTWSFDTGDGAIYGLAGWGNKELEYYTEDSAKVGGILDCICAPLAPPLARNALELLTRA